MDRTTGEPIPAGIEPSMVESAIGSGFHFLRFPDAIERAFEEENSASRCRHLMLGGLLGVTLFNLFLIADWMSSPETFLTALLVRIGIITPIVFLLLGLLSLNPPVALRECVVVFSGVILGAGSNLYLTLLANGPDAPARHQSIILVLLFVTMIQRVRFYWSVFACLACFAIYAYGVAYLGQYSLQSAVTANLFFACAVMFSLFASYALEKESRMNYLLSLRGRLQRRELDLKSQRDPLTGLRNRRSLDEAIEACEQSPKPFKGEIAILLLDIDSFKSFNDSAGHQAGDVCLKRVAGIIQGELRDHADDLFRFGGEEFVVVLKGNSLPVAHAIAERIRAAVQEAAIPHPGSRNGEVVTISVGVASAFLGCDIGTGTVIAAADVALYAAKRSGRNQVAPRLAPPDWGEIETRKSRSI
jgi:diguanylate cyclase (GGDEF)-like protein